MSTPAANRYAKIHPVIRKIALMLFFYGLFKKSIRLLVFKREKNSDEIAKKEKRQRSEFTGSSPFEGGTFEEAKAPLPSLLTSEFTSEPRFIPSDASSS